MEAAAREHHHTSRYALVSYISPPYPIPSCLRQATTTASDYCVNIINGHLEEPDIDIFQ
jgi:hypothetical protein